MTDPAAYRQLAGELLACVACASAPDEPLCKACLHNRDVIGRCLARVVRLHAAAQALRKKLGAVTNLALVALDRFEDIDEDPDKFGCKMMNLLWAFNGEMEDPNFVGLDVLIYMARGDMNYDEFAKKRMEVRRALEKQRAEAIKKWSALDANGGLAP